jgi:tetratricopeptide (TPR) repeat protein
MKDPIEKKNPSQEDDLHAIDNYYVEIDKKQRRRKIVVIVFSILIVVGVIFAQNLFDLFKTGNKQPSKQIEKEAKETKTRIGDAEWKAISATVKTLLDEGKVDEAQNQLTKILSGNPDIAEANYLAGTAYMRQGRIQSAYDKLRQAITLRPDYYEAQEKLGEIYLLAGDYKAAKDVATTLTKGGDYLQDGLLLEAEIAMAQGNVDEALNKAGAAATGDKAAAKVKASAYLADLYLKKGEKAKANKVARSLDAASLNSDGLLSLAKYYLGAGNDAQAVALFKQALARYPDSAEANYNYGQYLFKKGQYQEAVDYYKKAMAVVPSIQIIAYQLTQCLLATDRYNEAKTQIDAMIQKYPNSLLTLGLKLQYHLLVGERHQAIVVLNQIARMIPLAPRPYTILASLYWQEGMIPLAEKNALKAMSLGEKTVLPHLMVGDILFNKKQFAQALSYYERVLEVQPDNIIALLQTGDVFLAMGQPKRAEERYAKALAANPKVKSIRTKIAWAKAQGGDLEGALTLNRQYLHDMPNDPQAVTAFANTLIAANRLDEAMDLVQKNLLKQPKAWSLHYLLGDIYFLKKDFKSATASYGQALSLNPNDVNMALNVGARYEKIGIDTETERYYVDIRKKFRYNALVANQLAWFYIDRMGTPLRAKDLVETLMAETNWPEMSDTIGWYYYKMGEFISAESYFRQALLLMPDHPETRARLALTLLALKKKPEAEAEGQKALAQMAPGSLKNTLAQAMAQGKK